MTPKEKAKSLVNKMIVDFKIDAWQSKQCALVAVDEIIKSNPTNPQKSDYILLYSEMVDEAIYYWQEVKKEIENI